MAAAQANSWHRDIKTWNQRNEFLFKNEIMSDCKFIVTDGGKKTIIPAHKYVLGGNSEEFYNLFYLMRSSDEIPIEDTSADILTKFLEFLYTEKTNLTMDNVDDLLKLSKRYSVKHFEKFCGAFLSENVSEETALSVMDKYSDYEMPELISECINCINRNQLTFESPSFLKVNIRTISELLKSEDLKGFNEITIFNGVNKWAENFCQENNLEINSENKRMAVKPALKYIRFPVMAFKDLATCTINHPLLTGAEIVQIMQFVGSNGQSECTFSGIKRRTNERTNERKTFNIILQDHLIATACSFNNINIFSISVNKPILFHGFGMLGRTETVLDETIIKLKDNDGSVLCETTVKLRFDGSEQIYEHLFENPVWLKPNITYKVFMHSNEASSAKIYYLDNFNPINKEIDGVLLNVNNNAANSNFIFTSIIYSQK